MSPIPFLKDVLYKLVIREVPTSERVTKPTDPDGLVLEAWAEGYMIGSLIIMSCITLANMRRGVLLHKLILLELVLGYWQGVFVLFNPPIYAWWLSVAAIPLNISWSLHNVIAWMKLRPFLNKTVSRIFIGTVILVQPYWVVEIYANFTYFHNINRLFLKTRPWEALCRDPWWIAAVVILIYNIKTKYDLSLSQIIRISPRFAVMLGAMMLSICFIILDVLSVTSALKSVLPVGINPFWKLSFVFKCLTDSVILDDFKTALDRLRAFKISRLGSFAMDNDDMRSREHRDRVVNANSWAEPPPTGEGPMPAGNFPAMPSPDGDYIRPQWEENKFTEPDPSKTGKFAGIERTASRDRDVEENGIHIEDYANSNGMNNSTHLSTNHVGWDPRQSHGSSVLDGEYENAVREITSSSGLHKSESRYSVGVAK